MRVPPGQGLDEVAEVVGEVVAHLAFVDVGLVRRGDLPRVVVEGVEEEVAVFRGVKRRRDLGHKVGEVGDGNEADGRSEVLDKLLLAQVVNEMSGEEELYRVAAIARIRCRK